ncbi:MAG: MgtC/SapB family protein [Longimicrobiales bacterium]
MDFLTIDALSLGATLGRLFLAALLGALIGFEREASGKPAGFRTNLLICLGAALITEVSFDVARDVTLPSGFRADPGRIAAQIVTGVGFLGAGTIMQARGSVIGLTTAATMWVVAGIGMAIGAGAYALGVTAAGLTLVALRVLRSLDDVLLSNRWREHTLYVEADAGVDAADVARALNGRGVELKLTQIERRQEQRVYTYRARGSAVSATSLSSALTALPGIQKVTID